MRGPRGPPEGRLAFCNFFLGTSLEYQWLRFRTPSAGAPGLIPGQGTRSHMPQLRVRMPQLKIPHTATKIPPAATKTGCSQINKEKFFLKELLLKNVFFRT